MILSKNLSFILIVASCLLSTLSVNASNIDDIEEQSLPMENSDEELSNSVSTDESSSPFGQIPVAGSPVGSDSSAGSGSPINFVAASGSGSGPAVGSVAASGPASGAGSGLSGIDALAALAGAAGSIAGSSNSPGTAGITGSLAGISNAAAAISGAVAGSSKASSKSSSSSSSSGKYEPSTAEEKLEHEHILRHVEVRRELEKEATPFLESIPPKLNLNVFNINYKSSEKLSNMPAKFSEILASFTLMDFVMGIFSVLSLGFGSVYFLWRMNPFASKVEK